MVEGRASRRGRRPTGFFRSLLAPRALPRTAFAVWLLAACGALAPKSYVNEQRSAGLQREVARQQEQLRQEAQVLREMADRREREAATLAQESPVERHLITRKQQLADELREAAREVETRAAGLARDTEE